MLVSQMSDVWNRADSLRGQVDVQDIVSAMSQLAVMVELGSRDRQFNDVIAAFIDEGGYIKDLLTKSLVALDAREMADPTQLIDTDDKCWSALTADSAVEMLKEIRATKNEMRNLALFLVKLVQSQGRRENVPPPELLSLMAEVLGDETNLYLPFTSSGIAGLSIAVPEQQVTIRLMDRDWAYLLRRLYFSMGIRVRCEIQNPYVGKDLEPSTSVLLVPPFGGRIDKTLEDQLPQDLRGPGRLASEEAALAAVACRGGGTIVALVSSGILSRAGRSRQFRKWLVEVAGLSAVFEMPERFLENSSVGSALLVIDPTTVETSTPCPVFLRSTDNSTYVSEKRKGRYALTGWQDLYNDFLVAHLNASEKLIRKSVLADDDYSLQPTRYSAREDSGLADLLHGRAHATLTSIADIRTPLPVRSSKAGKATEYAEVRISDFSSDCTIHNGSKAIMVDAEEINRIDRQVLRPGDILVGTKGTIGKAAIVSNDAPENLVAGQTTAILKVKMKRNGLEPVIEPIVLLRWLSLPIVRKYLESLSGGATISFLRKKDLAELPIPTLNDQQQRKILDVHDQILVALGEVERQRIVAKELANNAFASVQQVTANDL